MINIILCVNVGDMDPDRSKGPGYEQNAQIYKNCKLVVDVNCWPTLVASE
jgi:hypothetical protein